MLRCFVLLLLWGFSSSSSPTITLLAGSTFTLKCGPETDLMFLEYSWSFLPKWTGQRGGNVRFTSLNHTDEELSLSPVKRHHAGTYICVIRADTENGPMKERRTFTISVFEGVPLIKWHLIEGTEGESVTLPCFSSDKTISHFNSAKVKWFKVKEVGNEFVDEEFKPAQRSQSPNEEEKKGTPVRQIYWQSDLTEPDWSITINRLELEDDSLYRCDILTNTNKEKFLMELLVTARPPPRCLNQSHPWEACPDPDNKSWKAILSESLTDFSLKLYKEVNVMEPKSNLLFSPISIATMLSYLMLGTRGQTRSVLEHSLYLPSEFTCIHSEMRRLKSKTQDSVLIANQLFYNEEHQLNDFFVDQANEFYNSVPQKLTPNNEENKNLINNWVANQTQNRITELVDSLDTPIEFIILNAVYFIGKWKGTFEAKSGEFKTFSGDRLNVPILYSSSFELATSYIPDLKAIVGKFPLTGKNSLYVLVPYAESEKALQDMQAKLTDETLKKMMAEMSTVIPAASEVMLPKVKLLVDTDLNQLLKKLELRDIFDDPNLCGIFDQTSPMPLTDARHKAFLSLTEVGVEAAAVSSVSFSRSFGSFGAMRPFIMVVWNEEIDNPLFIGRVINPLKN